MLKNELILQLNMFLRKNGYKKKGLYWFRREELWIYCVNVQGSQWSTEDYYVNIGAASAMIHTSTPSILYWRWVHRCEGANGNDLNINLSDILNCLNSLFDEFRNTANEADFYARHEAIDVNGRMLF